MEISTSIATPSWDGADDAGRNIGSAQAVTGDPDAESTTLSLPARFAE